MEIRELTLEDFDTPLVDTLNQLPFVSEHLTREQLKNVFVRRKDHTITLIAVDGNQIVGHLCGSIHWSFIGTSKAVAYDLGIRESHQGQGIGLQISKVLESILTERCKVNYLVGPVAPSRVDFYQKLGAQIDKRTLFMSKTLNKPSLPGKNWETPRMNGKSNLKSKIKKILKILHLDVQVPR